MDNFCWIFVPRWNLKDYYKHTFHWDSCSSFFTFASKKPNCHKFPILYLLGLSNIAMSCLKFLLSIALYLQVNDQSKFNLIGKSQLISKCLLVSSILPKYELKNFNFCPILMRQTFFVRFLEEWKIPKYISKLTDL